MTNLTVRNRFAGDLLDLREDFDRIFHQFYKPQGYPAPAAENYFAVVPIQTWIDTEGKQLHLSVPLPGIKPEALNVTLHGNQLTVSGEWQDQKGESGKKYLAREFYFDRFERLIQLPDGIDAGRLTAELKDGVLEITAPFAAASLPKKIEVKGTQKDKNAPETAVAAAQGKGGAK